MSANRNSFRLTRLILLKIPLLFKFFARHRKPRKRILIIKTDAIGDYILFRNFIEVVSKSEKYNGYEIDFVGNSIWKELALMYDYAFVTNFTFIKPDDLYHSPLQTLKLGWNLYQRNYQDVLHPTYARTFITDGFAGFSAAKRIIGFDGDTERIVAKYKTKTDKFYTERLLLPESVIFEFDKSRFYFETILKKAVELKGPSIAFNENGNSSIVIFPGAGVFKRSWEADKFLALINLIKLQTSRQIYLAGGSSEIEIGSYLEANSPGIINLIDKTTLPQLIDLIGNAALVIANETSAVHIAIATNTKVVCILGGGHFGRFAPYPGYMENKPVCVYEKMDCYYCNWNCKFITAENEPYPCIRNISVAAVWNEAGNIIAQL